MVTGLGAGLRRAMAGLLYESVEWVNPEDGSKITIRCEIQAFSSMGWGAERYMKDPIFSQGNGILRLHPDEKVWPERMAACDHPRLKKVVTLLEVGSPDRTGMREGSVAWNS